MVLFYRCNEAGTVLIIRVIVDDVDDGDDADDGDEDNLGVNWLS